MHHNSRGKDSGSGFGRDFPWETGEAHHGTALGCQGAWAEYAYNEIFFHAGHDFDEQGRSSILRTQNFYTFNHLNPAQTPCKLIQSSHIQFITQIIK